MEFLKLKDYWTYQLPEWDNYNQDDIEDALESIESVTIVNYAEEEDTDIWNICYKDCDFVLANDLVHGCEIRTSKEEDLPVMEELIKELPL